MNRIPGTMRGVHLTGHGDLDKLEVKIDIRVPRPSPRDVLIQVAAAGVNNTDINTRKAWYSKGDGADEDASWAGNPLEFPRIQGIDVCGRIVAVGDQVEDRRIGERVLVEPCLREVGGEERDRPGFLGSECDGGFAEYVVVAARHAFPIRSELSDVELASFPCSYSTAENMLTRANVASGDRVLVTGASGGVGSAAVQLATARGAEVVAVTSGSKADTLMGLGATRTLSRDDVPADVLGKDSIDVVVDLVGGAAWPRLLDALHTFGRYAVAGAIAGPMVELDLRTLYLKDLSFFGCTILGPEVFGQLIDHIEDQRIRPVVAETFPLERIADAQRTFMDKKYIGKIVLEVEAKP